MSVTILKYTTDHTTKDIFLYFFFITSPKKLISFKSLRIMCAMQINLGTLAWWITSLHNISFFYVIIMGKWT